MYNILMPETLLVESNLNQRFLDHLVTHSTRNILIFHRNYYLTQLILTLQHLVSTKSSYIPKQTCDFQMLVCLSVHDFLVELGVKFLGEIVSFKLFVKTQQANTRLMLTRKTLD